MHDSFAPAPASGMAVGMAGRDVLSAALLLPASPPQIRLPSSSSGMPGSGGRARRAARVPLRGLTRRAALVPVPMGAVS
eukprot:6440248-Prymnesium_polylepis.1